MTRLLIPYWMEGCTNPTYHVAFLDKQGCYPKQKICGVPFIVNTAETDNMEMFFFFYRQHSFPYETDSTDSMTTFGPINFVAKQNWYIFFFVCEH